MAEAANWMDMDGAGTPAGGLIVQFYRGTKLDPIATQAQGIPVHKGIDYVKVGIAGEKDNTIFEVDLVRADRRWPEQYRAYKEGREQIGDGTPLEVLFPASPEIVLNMKANHIHTVQQLANYPDSGSMGFATTYKQRAQQFLKGLEGNKFLEMEQMAKNAQNEVAELKAMVAQLSTAQAPVRQAPMIEAEPPRRGPGRPPKIREEGAPT